MNATLHRCSPDDRELTKQWLVRQYDFEPNEVEQWLDDYNFDWPLSVKAIDDNHEVVGLLNMSHYGIDEECEQITAQHPHLVSRLNAMRYVAVFSFIVRDDYRGTRLNYEMMMDIWEPLQAYDFLFIPVMHHLKTHTYWQRWGAVEFYRDDFIVLYMLPFSQRAKLEARKLHPQGGQHQ